MGKAAFLHGRPCRRGRWIRCWCGPGVVSAKRIALRRKGHSLTSIETSAGSLVPAQFPRHDGV
jgi:hypothetical protein